MDQFFLIAKIIALHGSNGSVLISSYSDFSERFFELENIFLEFFGVKKEFKIDEFRKSKGKLILKLKGFSSTSDSKLLIGKEIFIDERDSVKLKSNTFFIHDIIGLEVFRNKVLLGVVEDIFLLPANDVYVIKTPEEKRIFVPAIKDYINKIDLQKKKINLVDDCDLLYDEN